MSVDLGGGASIQLKKIPAGEFVMGDVDGYGNEYPTAAARIEKPFWIGATEVSLAQYQQFDPNHRNGYYDMHYKDQVKPGYLMDSPDFPVIRVSWDQAMAFCQWLSTRTGKKVLLPTEAQWEWACRAGSGTPMFYGGLDSDFSTFANLADASLSKLAVSGVDPQPIKNPDKFWDFVPKEARFNDGTVHLAPVGQYQPNAWGLHNMIGNVAEWTLDDYRPYPYQPQTACAGIGAGMRKAVRGGSWADRPKESRASARWDYPQWQRVYNVGFRIVVPNSCRGMNCALPNAAPEPHDGMQPPVGTRSTASLICRRMGTRWNASSTMLESGGYGQEGETAHSPGPCVLLGAGSSSLPCKRQAAEPSIAGQPSGQILAAGDRRVMVLSPAGEVLWEYPTKLTHDAWMLPSGNVLFADGETVTEVTREKQVVFQYRAAEQKGGGTYACQRLPDGKTFVGENSTGRLLELDPDGKVVFALQTSPFQTGEHHNMRMARKLANGNYLVCHSGARLVKEYTPRAKWCGRSKCRARWRSPPSGLRAAARWSPAWTGWWNTTRAARASGNAARKTSEPH